MAGQVRTRIVIDADGNAAVQTLGDVEQAAEKADQAVEELSDATVDIDGSDALTELARIEAEAQDVENELDDIDNTTVKPDIDTAGVRRARQDVGDLSDTAQRGVGPLRGLTDELGESAAGAGVLGNALIDGGEAVQIFGERAGLSTRLMSGLTTAFTVAAPVAAGAVLLWQQISAGWKRAEETGRRLLEVQESLADNKYRDAAEGLAEAWRQSFADLERHGIDATTAVQLARGELDLFNDVWTEYHANLSAFQQEQIISLIDNMQQGWAGSAEELARNEEQVDALARALGFVEEETDAVGATSSRVFGQMRRDITRTDLAVQGLLGQIDDRQAWRNLETQAALTLESIGNAFDAGTRSAEEQAAAVRAAESDLDALRTTVILYAQDVLALPPEMITEIDAKMRDGAVEEVTAQLDRLTVTRQAVIDVVLGNVPGSTYIPPAYPTPPGGGGLPEPAPAPVVPPGVRTVVNVRPPATADPITLAPEVQRYQRVNGNSLL